MPRDNENKPKNGKKRKNSTPSKRDDEIERPGQRRNAPQKRLPDYSVSAELYRYLYFLGMMITRFLLRQVRFIQKKWAVWKSRLHTKHRKRKHWMQLRLRSRWQSFIIPLRESKGRFLELRADLRSEIDSGSQREYFRARAVLTKFVAGKLLRAFVVSLNVIAPIAAVVFLIYTVDGYRTQEYALRLEFNGQDLGFVADESVFSQAETAMRGRLMNEAGEAESLSAHFELMKRNDEPFLSVDELTDILISSSGNELREADGLYIENTRYGRSTMELVGAVENGQELLGFMDNMLEQYRTSNMSRDTQITFLKKVQMKRGLYPVSSIRPLEEVEAELTAEEQGEKNYTVVEGDTPLRIATKNGVTLEELKRLNPDIEDSLFPGDTLLVSKPIPRMEVKVVTTIQYEEETDYKIRQETVPSKTIGWANVKQTGQKGVDRVIKKVTMIDGIEVDSPDNSVTRKSVVPAVDQIVEVGGSQPLKVIPESSSGKLQDGAFIWPTMGGRIGPGFRGYYGHTGSDISFSGCYGTPVYASVAGTVTLVKYDNYSYGYHIIVDNGGGISTLYAHCSELYVTVGQQISQGQQIAAIGRTGNATGPHLHFEIRVNGTPVDASPYLSGLR